VLGPAGTALLAASAVLAAAVSAVLAASVAVLAASVAAVFEASAAVLAVSAAVLVAVAALFASTTAAAFLASAGFTAVGFAAGVDFLQPFTATIATSNIPASRTIIPNLTFLRSILLSFQKISLEIKQTHLTTELYLCPNQIQQKSRFILSALFLHFSYYQTRIMSAESE
jgi:hypothetical protein